MASQVRPTKRASAPAATREGRGLGPRISLGLISTLPRLPAPPPTPAWRSITSSPLAVYCSQLLIRIDWGVVPRTGHPIGFIPVRRRTCAEVSVDKGRVKVHRLVGATNCGHAVNPEQIARQVEGSFVYGLSSLLYGECTVRDGRIEQTNFDSWEVMRLDAMPKVETVVMPDGEFWGGVGEPTISVAAPAVLNAIFAATGKRIRTIPIKDIDLSAA